MDMQGLDTWIRTKHYTFIVHNRESENYKTINTATN